MAFHFMSFHIISFHFMSFRVISCHFRSFHVSLDFSDQLSIKSGRGRGRGRAGSNLSSTLPRPLATASLTGRRQKYPTLGH
jgi:hypothetical protein